MLGSGHLYNTSGRLAPPHTLQNAKGEGDSRHSGGVCAVFVCTPLPLDILCHVLWCAFAYANFVSASGGPAYMRLHASSVDVLNAHRSVHVGGP